MNPWLPASVTLLLVGLLANLQGAPGFPRTVAPEVVQLTELPSDVFKECSGLVVSRQFAGVLWTHNDGQDRRLFAINREGRRLATFEVQGAFIWDWEDLTLDHTNRLYVADIGNNLEIRPSLIVHRIAEPDPAQGGGPLKIERSWVLRFPGKRFDAEGLFVWGEHGYVVEKSGKSNKAELLRWKLDGEPDTKLEELGKLEVKSPVTGAALSRDGAQLGLVADDGVYVIRFNHDFEELKRIEPFKVPFKLGQIEGCAFDQDGLLVVSEERELFLFKAPPFRPGPEPSR